MPHNTSNTLTSEVSSAIPKNKQLRDTGGEREEREGGAREREGGRERGGEGGRERERGSPGERWGGEERGGGGKSERENLKSEKYAQGRGF
jgi:hypothetical protein